MFFTSLDTSSDSCWLPLSQAQAKKLNVEDFCILFRFAFFTKQKFDYCDFFNSQVEIEINDVPLPLSSKVRALLTRCNFYKHLILRLFFQQCDKLEEESAEPIDISRYCYADGSCNEKIKIIVKNGRPHIFSVVFARRLIDTPIVCLRYFEPNQTIKLSKLYLNSNI